MAVHVQGDKVSITAGRQKIKRQLTLGELTQGWRDHTSGDPLTKHVTEFAESFVRNDFQESESYLFVRLVCAWGGLRGVNQASIKKEVFRAEHGTGWLRKILVKGRLLSIAQVLIFTQN